MPEIFEFGIIGMGPAGIGMAMSLCSTSNNIKNTICFERGSYSDEKICSAFLQNECCYSNVCTVISGLGGASTLSSGKISNFPAGSGLVEFFDSEQQLKELLNEIILFLSNKIALKKVEIDSIIKKDAQKFYEQRQIEYKYYDVYEFDGKNYRDFIQETIQGFRVKGLQIFDNSEVTDVKRDPSALYFRVKVKALSGERVFLIRNLILATGALDIQDRLIEKVTDSIKNSYEIGVRIEAPASAFGNILSTHGDLKLKLGSGRTYCVTANGKIISYQTGGAIFLEGSMDPFETTGYTNLAVLIKSNNDNEIRNFIKRYYAEFRGLPVKQRLVDYINGQISREAINTTLTSAIGGDINTLLPTFINDIIKDFIDDVIVGAMGISKDVVVVVAPELKILRNLQLAENFELDRNFFVIGAATGKFRGILQSFCSGVRCGRLLDRE
ncbi:hypothetical protein B5F10_02080 [Anaerotruncus colihominis]|uniref:Uncharacterized protein n=1 Tax=Anaerotruncus colihominis TaxID=169435 RepID=A0A1Y4MRD2_9FIRM|nr:hypothetical protein [Anaerotruncus colihominis]OUP70719.1 hypothetical protein B5F11_04540 [Anaerotruncus colihominis]OUP75945.1 hypothetical protein B5F10_02080 [Anaerotruncus colihominis]